MGYSRAEIAAELNRRGISTPPAAPHPEQKSTHGYSREQIAAELSRRGIKVPAEQPAASSSELNILQKIAQIPWGTARATEGLLDLANMIGSSYTKAQATSAAARRGEEVPEGYRMGFENPKPIFQGKLTKPIEKLARAPLEPAPGDTWGHARALTGEFLTPIGGPVAKGVKSGIQAGVGLAGKALGAAKGFAKGLSKEAPLAAALAGGQTGLEEMGVSPVKSGLIASTIPVTLPLAARASAELAKGVRNRVIPSYRAAHGQEMADSFLQHKVGKNNIPKVVENLQQPPIEIPGYEQMPYEIAQSPGLSQVQRSFEGTSPLIGERQHSNRQALQGALDKLGGSGEHTLEDTRQFATNSLNNHVEGIQKEVEAAHHGRQQSVEPFERHSKPEQTGRAIRGTLSDEVSRIEKKASEEAAPAYAQAEKEAPYIKPKNAVKYITDQLKKWTGSIHSDLQEIRNKFLFNPSDSRKGMPSSTLDNARANIQAKIESIPIQEKRRRGVLHGVIGELDKDFDAVSSHYKARQIFRENIEPANQIKEETILGGILKKKKGYTKNFLVKNEHIPDKFMSEVETSRQLNQLLEGKPEAKDTVTGYINSSIFNNIVDESGKVNINRLNMWKKNNPGAFELYPGLEKSLENARTAQIKVDQIEKRAKTAAQDYYKGVAQEFLEHDPDKLMNRILSGTNRAQKTKEVVRLAEKDKTGAAKQGLRLGTIQYMNRNFSEKLTPHKFNNFLQNNKLALKEIFDEDQIKMMESVRKGLNMEEKAAGLGIAKGSPTSANLHNLAEMIGKFGQKLKGMGKFGKMVYGTWDLGKGFADPKLAFIEQALLDKNKLKLSLTNPVKDYKSFEETLKELGKSSKEGLYMVPRALLINTAKEAKE